MSNAWKLEDESSSENEENEEDVVTDSAASRENNESERVENSSEEGGDEYVEVVRSEYEDPDKEWVVKKILKTLKKKNTFQYKTLWNRGQKTWAVYSSFVDLGTCSQVFFQYS